MPYTYYSRSVYAFVCVMVVIFIACVYLTAAHWARGTVFQEIGLFGIVATAMIFIFIGSLVESFSDRLNENPFVGEWWG